MTTTSFVPPALMAAISVSVGALSAVGIIVGEPCGDVTIAEGWAEIGAVIIHDDGVIEAVPCRDATMRQRLAVIDQAQVSRFDGPQGNWWIRIGAGWYTSVFESTAFSPMRAS